MSNGHGGLRPGAGRKRGPVREILDSASAQADKMIAEHLPQAIKNMIVLANGVTVQEELTGDGVTPIVYTRPPDRQANEYLINRVMGKPTEKIQADVNSRVEIAEIETVMPADEAEA